MAIAVHSSIPWDAESGDLPLSAALSAWPDGVAVCNLAGSIVMANIALDRLVGYPAGSLCGAELELLLPRMAIESAADVAFARRESVVRRADGALIAAEVSLGTFRVGDETYVLATIRDISQRLQAEKQLRDNATHDGLTGTLNRATVMQLGEVELLRSRRYGRDFAFIMLDIDHFKAVNDRYCHPAGDAVLRAVAEVCKTSLRNCDLVGRYGGEEFVLMLPETGTDGAVRVAERIRRTVAGMRTTEVDRQTTVSAGVAALTASIFDLNTLIVTADRALYRAKRAGRDRVETA
ncbi:MAG: sensor domain-containing diguanylate cyclase [Alphaproteobacteria bacterium]|nr:sensor domain-containing diguanylate cyclase [Alphaproteobacteria bacterium]